jgi:hypothetical protein
MGFAAKPPSIRVSTNIYGIDSLSESFGSQVLSASREIRRCVSEALGAAGCLGRVLKLDKSLAWKAARLVTDPDVLTIPRRLPGKEGMRLFAEALRARGIAPALVVALEESIEKLRKLEADHADDRDAFSAMLAGVGGASSVGDESLRRLSFTGNSATWGVRTRMQIACTVLAPGTAPGRLDLGLVSGFVDFQRLRPNVPWAIATFRRFTDENRTVSMPALEAIDQSAPLIDDVPLMHEFCTSPLPAMRFAEMPDGARRLILTGGDIGKSGSATILTGWLQRNVVSMYRTKDDARGEHHMYLSTPAEWSQHDVYVHRSLGFSTPRAGVYSMLPGGPQYPRDELEAARLPVPADVIDLGTPPDTLTPEFPTYHVLVERVMARVGFAISEFRGYRVRLRYPPIPAVSSMVHDLLEPPEVTPA